MTIRFIHVARLPNAGINRRAFNAGTDKLSMKDELTRVRFNDLLGARVLTHPTRFEFKKTGCVCAKNVGFLFLPEECGGLN